MQFDIQPTKAKINDTVDSTVIDVTVNQDNGTTCNFVYNVGVSSAPIANIAQRPQSMVNGNFKISGDDYTNYSNCASASARMQFAAQYVATQLSLTLVA